jgi:hypothetical protein
MNTLHLLPAMHQLLVRLRYMSHYLVLHSFHLSLLLLHPLLNLKQILLNSFLIIHYFDLYLHLPASYAPGEPLPGPDFKIPHGPAASAFITGSISIAAVYAPLLSALLHPPAQCL